MVFGRFSQPTDVSAPTLPPLIIEEISPESALVAGKISTKDLI
jgi:hypothetical protein